MGRRLACSIRHKMKMLKKYFPVISIAVLCIIIIAIWFKDGKLLATGEDGLMLINPDRAIEIYKYSWNEVRSGGAFPGSSAMIPFYYIESLILKIGIPIWIFQSSVFLLLMFTGSISVYYLVKELFNKTLKENLKIKVAFIAALFYILNPISLFMIWYRGIAVYSFIFFYALAPLFFYLYILGINHRKFSFIIITPLITLFFSTAFASPSEPLLLWFLPFLYSLILTLVHPISWVKFRFFPMIYFTAVFIIWILINLWWIFPYIEFSSFAYFSEKNSLGHAINTLKANSKDFTLDNVIRLIHGGFLYRNETFGSVYKLPFFLILSWLIPIFTIYGLIKLKSGQIKLFFTLSLILLLFLAKGTSFPLSGVFLWFFSHIAILQIFRNPFEKFGMLMPIIYAPLFTIGLFYIADKIKKNKKRIIFLILALALLAIFHWPFFSGALAVFDKRDIRVIVPSSFKNANKSIPAGNHVILSVPVMGGASGFYKWKYGYKGVEAGHYLFDYPVVTVFYDAESFYGQVLIGISNSKVDNLVGIAQLFSADIIAYRKDTDVAAFGYNLNALERFEKMINASNLNMIFDSPQVSLWSLPEEKIVPAIYIPHSIRFGDSPSELIELLKNKQFDPKLETFICINNDKCKPNLTSQDPAYIRINAIPEKVEFIKISPVNYDIKVENSKGRFLLVFNNNYHPGWVAFVEGKPISANKHIIANGYANGFIIDDVGNFDISLRFIPEEKFYKFYKISFFAIFLGLLILFGSIIKFLVVRNIK